MAAPADDEWEYEYDDVETEDFYIPIDMSNVPKGQKHAQDHTDSERRMGHPTLLKSRLRALDRQRERNQQQDASTVDNANAEEPALTGEAQIIGLHTENPLVMYNGQLLSLQWAATVGTDMFFSKPDPDAASDKSPLRAMPDVDLLAMSSAKLIARVGRLRPKDELFHDAAVAEGTAVQNAENVQEPATVSEAPPNSFLARLNAAKARKGESSRLALSMSGDEARLVATSADVVPNAAQDTVQDGDDTAMGDNQSDFKPVQTVTTPAWSRLPCGIDEPPSQSKEYADPEPSGRKSTFETTRQTPAAASSEKDKSSQPMPEIQLTMPTPSFSIRSTSRKSSGKAVLRTTPLDLGGPSPFSKPNHPEHDPEGRQLDSYFGWVDSDEKRREQDADERQPRFSIPVYYDSSTEGGKSPEEEHRLEFDQHGQTAQDRLNNDLYGTETGHDTQERAGPPILSSLKRITRRSKTMPTRDATSPSTKAAVDGTSITSPPPEWLPHIAALQRPYVDDTTSTRTTPPDSCAWKPREPLSPIGPQAPPQPQPQHETPIDATADSSTQSGPGPDEARLAAVQSKRASFSSSDDSIHVDAKSSARCPVRRERRRKSVLFAPSDFEGPLLRGKGAGGVKRLPGSGERDVMAEEKESEEGA
ncbi:hypothetical protein E8E13_006632 [Curvularia kusanoi]|uniref:Transcription factor TFIIIC triple barrel domain-containing protein n=1 Tax=Curvularia kusanoi TaxID=90978 RepID=A0A9P4TJS1_CURKU|nr:hypothetical protein E8E13_006632 [Curvularia kusanoi]